MKLKKVGKKIGGATCSPTGSARASVTSVNSRVEFAAGHKAGGASRAQRPDRAPLIAVGSLKEEYKAGQKGRGTHCKKLLKIVGAGGLAILMCAGVLCGTLISPMNLTHATTSGSEENLLTPQEKLLAGTGLGLDPKNDPVIYKTAEGLEIKYGGAALSSGTSTITSLSGYAYVTMGGTNWIIIGQSSTTSGNYSIHTYYKDWATSSYVEKQTDAGNAIWTATNHVDYGTLQTGIYGTTINFPNAVKSSELKAGELLCFSEVSFGSTKFNNVNNNESTYCNYIASTCLLKTAVDNRYNNFSDFEKKFVKITNIKTGYVADSYYDDNSSKFVYTYAQSSANVYLFPLATCLHKKGNYAIKEITDSRYTSQNFLIETYLGNNDYYAKKNIGAGYWLRTGTWQDTNSYIYEIYRDGRFTSTYPTDSSGIRPAFVLQL